MTRKNTLVLFFILGISFLLSLCFTPPYDLMRDDREVFSYAGMAILKGQVPYRDFFDHKPPGIFFINAAGRYLAGYGAYGRSMRLLPLSLPGCCTGSVCNTAWLSPGSFHSCST